MLVTLLLVIQMTREPGKMAKVFIALISLAAVAVALAGGIFVSNQQAAEEQSGLWETVTPLIHDYSLPVFSGFPVIFSASQGSLFSSPPP
jgi:hypothetical protein